jgi:ribonucleoside-diphosphate reductase alpha chain
MATSIVDYLFRTLAVEYLGRYDLAHVKPEGADAIAHVGFVGGGSKEDRISDSELPTSLSYTKEAVARSAAEAESLETQRTTAHEPGAVPPSIASTSAAVNPLDAQLDAMMGDAPVCDVCGHITVRNGACYKCLNCGNSMGCS